MNTTVRSGAVVFLLVLSAACGSSGPTSPTRSSQPPAFPKPAPPPTPAPPPSPAPSPSKPFPPLSGPSRTFIFDHELSYRVSGYTTESRFVLYDDGAFVLQYVGLGAEYQGGFTEANGVITFQWQGGGSWGATGTVTDDSLTVRYNLIMQMTDFEDAVYSLMP